MVCLPRNHHFDRISVTREPKALKVFNGIDVFLKIRLNLFDENIGDRFGVHKSTVSRNFHSVLDVMTVKTAHLLKWPDRETLRQTMPVSFWRFFKGCCVFLTALKCLSSALLIC